VALDTDWPAVVDAPANPARALSVDCGPHVSRDGTGSAAATALETIALGALLGALACGMAAESECVSGTRMDLGAIGAGHGLHCAAESVAERYYYVPALGVALLWGFGCPVCVAADGGHPLAHPCGVATVAAAVLLACVT